MDKEQATQYTLNRLRAGYKTDEISAELSQILNAPREITSRFVSQVEASFSIKESFSSTQEDNSPEQIQTVDTKSSSKKVSKPNIKNSDLPPGLQALLLEGNAYIEPAKPNPPPEQSQTPDGDLPTRAEFIPTDQGTSKAAKELSTDKLELLEDEVLKQLKRKRRNNDIVEDICHQTGWHWNKSQRFVARVKTKNFEQLQTSQNRTTIIVGGIIIIVGLVMVLAGGSTLSDYAKIAAFAKTNPETLLSIEPEIVFFALTQTITGIGMIIGGGYGISRTMTNN